MGSALREQGLLTGKLEALRFLKSAPNIMNRTAERNQRDAYEWLEEVVKKGRTVLRRGCDSDTEIEAWDNACRIMFLLCTLRARNVNLF